MKNSTSNPLTIAHSEILGVNILSFKGNLYHLDAYEDRGLLARSYGKSLDIRVVLDEDGLSPNDGYSLKGDFIGFGFITFHKGGCYHYGHVSITLQKSEGEAIVEFHLAEDDAQIIYAGNVTVDVDELLGI